MKGETLLDLFGLIGLILAPSAFIEGIDPYIKYPASIFAVIALGIYTKLSYNEKIIKLIKQNKEGIGKMNNRIIGMNGQIERIKGWIESTEHFFPFKNKKGFLDPITLLVIIIIIIIIIIWIQKGG
ncbi:hypothetical protein KY366_03575 [Candidatus Woesearchaeota archaeon]|nr:hypothetical protein [Candidatus Woesearchaeota archaeon]